MSTPVRRAIYGRLAGDTTLNNLLGTPVAGRSKAIYYQVAPQGANYPLVIFNKQDGRPTEAFGDPSAYETDIWLVKGVETDDDPDTAEAIQDRIRVLLNDAPLSISGAALMYLRRQSDVDYDEVDDGQQYKHAGSLYRLVAD